MKGFPLEVGIGAGVRREWNDGATDGRKSFKIGLAVLIQYLRVTDRHPATEPASQPPSHVAVAYPALITSRG